MPPIARIPIARIPIARITGLVFIWMSPACLFAQTADYQRQTVPPATHQVMPAEFQAAVPADNQPSGQPAGLSLPPPGRGSGMPLAAAGNARQPTGKSGRPSGLPSLVTAGSSLAVVLGLFFVFAWVMRRTTPGGLTLLPSEVVEILGRAPLASRQQVHLIRLGSKLLLVSVTQAGVETLSEVTDPEEVDRLAGICRQTQSGSSTEAFRQVFQHFAGGRTNV